MYEKIIKRIIDIVVSLAALLLLWPVGLFIALIIKLEDKGPVFYSAPRIGRCSEKFYMHKFRTMKVNAPDYRNPDGSTFNSNNDPRVTRIGKFLRSTSIDELPQLLNVLKGEMSLLGPRASTWDALATYQEDELDKMNVRPGISGFCQAYYRNNLPLRDKRLKDAWYANNITFVLDCKIFFKTIQTVLRHENLYTNKSI